MSTTQSIKLEKLVNAIPTINKIVKCEIPIKTAFRLSTLVKELNKHLDTYNENRQKLIEKYSTSEKNDDGEEITVIPKEKISDFTDENSQLGSEEVSLEIPEITIDMLGDIKLSTTDIMSVEWLFSDI